MRKDNFAIRVASLHPRYDYVGCGSTSLVRKVETERLHHHVGWMVAFGDGRVNKSYGILII